MSEALVVDFFTTQCQTGPHSDAEFGIRDTAGSVAFVDQAKQNENDYWIVTVKNPNQLAVTFTAVDGCIFHSSHTSQRCDVMLTTAKCLHLVELKNRKHPTVAFKDGKAQLIATIEALKASCDVSQFKVRMAHVCNKRKPDYRSHESHRDFVNSYGFVLKTETIIHITE